MYTYVMDTILECMWIYVCAILYYVKDDMYVIIYI